MSKIDTGRLPHTTPCEDWPAQVVDIVSGIPVASRFGEFVLTGYRVAEDEGEDDYLVITKCVDPMDAEHPLLLRLHSACISGDIFGFERCDCQWQLAHTLKLITSEGRGMLIYALGEEGRGAGLMTKLRSYLLMDKERVSTAEAFRRLGVPVEQRSFCGAIAILCDFGVRKVRLVTNNPGKVEALRAAGMEVHEVIPAVMPTDEPDLIDYLRSKRDEFGHIIPEAM